MYRNNRPQPLDVVELGPKRLPSGVSSSADLGLNHLSSATLLMINWHTLRSSSIRSSLIGVGQQVL